MTLSDLIEEREMRESEEHFGHSHLPAPQEQTTRPGRLRAAMMWGTLIALLTLASAVANLWGQTLQLRQTRALESISGTIDRGCGR